MLIEDRCLGYRKLNVGSVASRKLVFEEDLTFETLINVSGAVKTVEFFIEPNALAVEGAIIARYTLNDFEPTDSYGIPIKAFEKVIIKNNKDANLLKIKAVDGNDHVIQSYYFNFKAW